MRTLRQEPFQHSTLTILILCVIWSGIGFSTFSYAQISFPNSPSIIGENVQANVVDLAIASSPIDALFPGLLAYAFTAKPQNATGLRVFVSVEQLPVGSGRFSDPIRVSDGRGDDIDPTIAVDSSGNAHVAWSGLDGQNRRQIYYAQISSTGSVNRSARSITDEKVGVGATQPQIAAVRPAGFSVSNDRTFIAYRGHDPREPEFSNYEILLLRSSGSVSFEDTPVNISQTKNRDEQNPTISFVTPNSGEHGSINGAVAWDNGAGIIFATLSGFRDGTITFGRGWPIIPTSSGGVERGMLPSLAVQSMSPTGLDGFVGHLAFV